MTTTALKHFRVGEAVVKSKRPTKVGFVSLIVVHPPTGHIRLLLVRWFNRDGFILEIEEEVNPNDVEPLQ